MDAVLEHIPNVSKAFSEVSRVLKKGGLFIGYVAFMECFHEISYSHLSFKALEYFSEINGLKLIKISGGGRFGIDYHVAVLLYPIKLSILRKFIAFSIRLFLKIKSKFAYLGLRIIRKLPKIESKNKSIDYYNLEILRQSTGYGFVIEKL